MIYARFWRRALLAATLAVAGLPTNADAQPSAQRALDLAYEAEDLFAKGNWDDAYNRFQQADALAHSPVFVLFMARSKKNAGKLLEASSLYERVATEKLATDAPKPFRAATSDAASELSELRGRIPHVRVVVTGAPQGPVDVRVDGEPIETDKLVALDPGAHVFSAKTLKLEKKETVVLPSAARELRVELSFSTPRRDQTRPVKRGSLAPGIAFVSLAAAGLELGAIMGGLATKTSDDVKAGCIDDHCLTSDAADLDRARLFANVSTGAFVAGGAFMVTGIVLLVLRPGGASAPAIGVGPRGFSFEAAF